jgi:chromatin segregation and condensation protein Rec8/ScpA/Scc1 (kleisin family)
MTQVMTEEAWKLFQRIEASLATVLEEADQRLAAAEKLCAVPSPPDGEQVPRSAVLDRVVAGMEMLRRKRQGADEAVLAVEAELTAMEEAIRSHLRAVEAAQDTAGQQVAKNERAEAGG